MSKNKKITLIGLNKFNLVMAGLHFVQALAVWFISKDYPITLRTGYLSFNTETRSLEPNIAETYTFNFVYLIVAFFLMSSVAHLAIATVYRKKYEKNLKLGINKARWIEYSVSASTMMVAIAILSGVYDLSTLVLMFSLTAGMNLMGLVMEVWNQGSEKINWLSYWIGCFLGIMPWFVYVYYLYASATYGGAKPPTFVYFILGTIFVMFNTFAINMWLQYKKVGRWSNYLYGERMYIILSLVAKSLLAWQVFSGTLRP